MALDEEFPIDQPNVVGAMYESYVAALWQRRGWRVEQVTDPNARDFGADLLVYDPFEEDGPPVYAVQCKYWSSPLEKRGSARGL